MNALTLAVRLLRRDLRDRSLSILLAALVTAVAAVAAIGFLIDRTGQVVERQAGALRGADLTVESAHPMPEDWQAQAAARGLRAGESIALRTVVFHGARNQLVALKAVGDRYPLRGELRVADRPFGWAYPAVGAPPPGEAWVEPRVLFALGLAIGDRVELGYATVRVTRVIVAEPDRGADVFQLAPRMLVALPTLAQAKLVTPHARVRYRKLYAGEPDDVAQWRAWLSERLAPTHRLQGRDGVNREFLSAMARVEGFLGLASLTTVLLATAAVAVAVGRYRERQIDSVALLRAFGMTGGGVLRVYGWQMLMVTLSAAAIGLALGWVIQALLAWRLADLFAAPLPAPGLQPLVAGVLTALATMLGFIAPGLLRLRQTPPLRVLRRDLGPPRLAFWVSGALGLAAIAAIVGWQAGDPRLAAKILIKMTILLSTVLTLNNLTLNLTTRALRFGPWALRFGAGNLRRRADVGVLQLAGFAVGLLSLLLLGLLRGDLLAAWENRLSQGAPNYFLINVQASDRAPLQAAMADRGLAAAQFYPVLRGRLTHLNGVPVAALSFESLRAGNFVNRDFNLSTATALPTGNRIQSGQWWRAESQQAEASLEAGLARDFGLSVGDTMAFDIAGTPLSLRITSLRRVQWDSMQPNFFVLAHPRVIPEMQSSYLTSFHAPAGSDDRVAALARQFPTVTLLDVRAVIGQVRTLVNRATLAIEAVFGLSLIAGVIVFLAAFEASAATRRQEVAVLRSFGARRSQLLWAAVVEWVALGALAGVVAAVTATAIAMAMAAQVFNLPLSPTASTLATGIAGGVALAATAGLISAWRMLRQPPNALMRAVD